MLDILLKGLKSQVAEKLQDTEGVSSGMIEKIIGVTGDVAKVEVAKEMISGNLGNVMNLFSNKENNEHANSLQDRIMQNLAGSYASKLGLNKQTAGKIAVVVVPLLVALITKKNNETAEDDASPIEKLFGDKESKSDSNPLKGMIGKTLGGLFGKK